MLPFQVDLSRLSYAMVLDLIAPILPGGTIALGWLYAHGAVWSNMHDERALKIILAGFAIYVIGLVVLWLSASEIFVFAVIVLLRRTRISEPWKNKEWRRVAVKFVGPELCPAVDEPVAESAAKPLPFTNVKKFAEALRVNLARASAPLDFQSRWQVWHEVLRTYFPVGKSAQQQAVENTYFLILHSIGWSGLAAAYISHGHISWLVWPICVLTILTSLVFFNANLLQQCDPDPSGNLLAAEILKAIKTRDKL